MTSAARWRVWLREPSDLPLRRGLLVASAVLLLLALGAPWKRATEVSSRVLHTPLFRVVTQADFAGSGVTSPANPTALVPDWSGSAMIFVPGVDVRAVAGAAHPIRVPIAVAGVLGFLAVRRRSRRLMAGALIAAGAGLVLTSGGSLMSPGWILLAAAAALAAFAVGLAPSSAAHHLA